ncbi:MAG: hypothetical protein ISQ73_05835 [Verrucomicrobiae bacterium]|nr:hypothetical protein [Verrucomicrobiae bacterium]
MFIKKLLILYFLLFFIIEETSSDTPNQGAFENNNTTSESANSEKKADVADSFEKDLQKPEVGPDSSWPSSMRLDPIFIEFPDLFTSPGMETDAIDPYMDKRAEILDATFNLGIQYRQEGKLDLSKKTFIRLIKSRPPVSYRKKALLQLALLAEKNAEWVRANQIYSHFDSLYPEDPNQILVHLKMADILRKTGSIEQALHKYHAVIAMTMKAKGYPKKYLPVIQRLGVKAKIEIAETHFLDGDYVNAARLYRRLLTQKHSQSDLVKINKPHVHYKLIDSHFLNKDYTKVEKESKSFVKAYGDHPKAIEVRYLYAKVLMKKSRNSEALEQFMKILENPATLKETEPETWTRLQVRIGVEISGLMAKDLDFPSAIQIHEGLLGLDLEENEFLEINYQLGILNEELKSYQKALAFYQVIINRIAILKKDNLSRHSKMIGDMAEWRLKTLNWFEAKESEIQRKEQEAQVSN